MAGLSGQIKRGDMFVLVKTYHSTKILRGRSSFTTGLSLTFELLAFSHLIPSRLYMVAQINK